MSFMRVSRGFDTDHECNRQTDGQTDKMATAHTALIDSSAQHNYKDQSQTSAF